MEIDMSLASPPPLTVRQPGEGREGDLVPGLGVVWKLDTGDTNGMVAVVEHPFAVGVLVPPHLHHREDEYSIVTEGKIGFRSGDREVVLGEGGYITKPREEVHAMWNAGQVPARMIEIISPGGFEGFFRELSELVASGPPPAETRQEIAERYGLEFAEPSWLPEIIQRYNLTPPPGA
jgi:mannose-6-phosphate isomerase-like protein (cupin superfamily)